VARTNPLWEESRAHREEYIPSVAHFHFP